MLMKNTLIAALIVALPTLAQEQPAPPSHWGAAGAMPTPGKRADMHARMLQKFDADKDGKLNENEKATMREEMAKHPRRKKNAHHPEGGDFRSNQHQHRARILKKFDLDHDGELNESEQAAMKAEHKRHRVELQQRLKDKFDANKDGKLDDTEKAAMRNAIENRRNSLRGHSHK